LSFSYNDILQIPERALLNKRLTKAFFTKHFSLNASEKKFLANEIQQMEWLASIKSSNVNIKAVVNEEYSFEELQIFVITLPDNTIEKQGKRAIEFVQKFIPYQALVIAEDGFEYQMGACDKRINQADNSKRTIERYFITSVVSKLYKNDTISAFYKAIAFSALDKSNLKTTYKSYINAIVQLQAAGLTGEFKQRSKVRSEEDMELMQQIENKETEIIQLRNQIKQESQLNGQVQLNVAIQGLKKEIEEIKNILSKD